MIWTFVAKAALAGVAASLVLTAPAAAAAAPTLATPAVRTGFGPVTLTGTATPGATVHLYETAIIFDDLQPAEDWQNGGGPVTATADSAGHFQIQRLLDSGFYFQVESGGLRSNKITVNIRVAPTLTLRSPGEGVVEATIAADPAQPGLPVQLQRLSKDSWSTVASGTSDSSATFTATESGLYAGSYTYRAYIGADNANGVLANYSAQQTVSVQGTTNPNPQPGTPTPGPAVGSVQFTRIQYNSPGVDSGSNASLNGEWAKLTNKTKATIDLKGWIVRDASAHVYTFSSTFRLGAGKSVVVRTGKGSNSSTVRFWGSRSYIWNNGGDTATLRTAAGKTIDACKWTTGNGATNC